MIIVSHRLDEVLELGHRVTVLQDGAVVAGDRPTSGLSESTLAELVLGRELEMIEEREGAPQRRSARGGNALGARSLTTAVLDGVDLEIAAGEVVGVTGAANIGPRRDPLRTRRSHAPRDRHGDDRRAGVQHSRSPDPS